MAQARKRQLVKKACLLGDSGVGKKTIAGIVAPFERGIREYTEKIGTAVTKYGLEFEYAGQSIRLMVLVWDITGKDHYQRVRGYYLTGAEGIVVVADASLPQTVASIPGWIESAREVVGEVPAVAIINKTDLVPKDQLQAVQLLTREMLRPFNAPPFFVNAQSSPRAILKAPFIELGRRILTRSSALSRI